MKAFIAPDELRRLAKGAEERSRYRGDMWDQLRDFVVRINRRRVNGVTDLTRREARQLEVLRNALGICAGCSGTGLSKHWDPDSALCRECGGTGQPGAGRPGCRS